MTIDLQEPWLVSYKFEDILQQINDERWCDSDDDCLDNDRDENLDDFSRLEDPLDKAGAGNKEDDEDDETPAWYHNVSPFPEISLHLALQHHRLIFQQAALFRILSTCQLLPLLTGPDKSCISRPLYTSSRTKGNLGGR